MILGEPGDVALVGAVTLESLALVLNPFDRSLKPMRLLLMQLRGGNCTEPQPASVLHA